MTRRFWLPIGCVVLVFLFLVRSILLPFVLGTLVAYFLGPVISRFQQKGLSREMATSLIVSAFFLLLTGIIVCISPIFFTQITGLVATFPAYAKAFDQDLKPLLLRWLGMLSPAELDSIKNALTSMSSVLIHFVTDFITNLLNSSLALVNILSLILITPIVAFYLLRDWDGIVTHVDGWLPRAHAQTIRTQLAIVNQTLTGFMHGQLNICLLLSLYYSLALYMVGLHFSIVVGILTGVLVIVPYMGWLFGTVVGIALAAFQFDNFNQVMLVLSIFMVGMVVEGNILTPKLVGKKVGLHPVGIIFGLLSGGALFGFVGVLLAVPVTAVIGVLLRFALTQYLGSRYYLSE